MADRPILFSAPMVKALLDGRKTQTRRILKPQPIGFDWYDLKCKPRFKVGDRLWVRETWNNAIGSSDEPYFKATVAEDTDWTAEERANLVWRPSIFMPRWASRLTLTVTDVRVERLQDISEEDAIAEGVPAGLEHIHGPGGYRDIWETINGAGSWAANPWVVAITFDVLNQNIDEVAK